MKTAIYIISILFIAQIICSQSIKDNQIEVMKEFNSEIYSAVPLLTELKYDIPRRQNLVLTKDSLLHHYDHKIDLTTDVQPIAYQYQKSSPPVTNFIQLNKGTLNNWMGELAVSKVKDNYYSLDLYGNFDQWSNPSIIDQYTQSINGRLGLKYYLSDQLTGRLTIGGLKNDFGQYAFNTSETTTTRDTISLNSYHGNFEIESFRTGSKAFNYALSGEYRETNLIDGQSETLLIAKPKISLNMGPKWYLQTNASYTQGMYKDDISSYALSGEFKLNYNTERLSQAIGINYIAYEDASSIFPIINTNYWVNDDLFLALRVHQDIIYQGAYSTLMKVPYVNADNINLAPAVNRTIAIAVSNRFNSKLTLALEASYQKRMNDQNFSNNADNLSSFDISLIDYNVLKFSTGLSYDQNEFLSAGMNLEYSKFETDETLYHRPLFALSPYVSLSAMNEKLKINLQGNFNTKQDLYTDQDARIIQSGIRKNVSFAVNYGVTKNIAIRLNGDNIFNDDFQALGGYQVFGRNLSGGIVIKF